jgi:hypothetical protein
MKTSFLKLGLILWAVVLCFNSLDYASSKSTFKGSIAAYRPEDRMIQVASFVENRELLLFRVEGNNGPVLKLVYTHQGYSDIKDDIIRGAKKIAIVVHRDSSCDQRLDLFEKDARSVPMEGNSNGASEKIIFNDNRSGQLPKSYILKCYKLDQWTPILSER